MSLSKTQTAMICALMAATPLAVQWNAQARLNREHTELSSQLNQVSLTMAELEEELRLANAAVSGNENELLGLEGRLAALDAQRTGRAPRPVYRWDDNSPLVRVPKQFLGQVPVASVSRTGQLTDGIKEVLQLNETEVTQVQAAMNRFLTDYAAAQTARMQLVPPTAEDLGGRLPEEVVVFELTAIGPRLGELRQQLFSALQSSLGSERYPLFQKSLDAWMPLDDEFHGMNSGLTIFNVDRRECFYRPASGAGSVEWKFSSKPAMSTMYLHLQVDDILPLYRPYLNDWIALAQNAPLTGETSEP